MFSDEYFKMDENEWINEWIDVQVANKKKMWSSSRAIFSILMQINDLIIKTSEFEQCAIVASLFLSIFLWNIPCPKCIEIPEIVKVYQFIALASNGNVYIF